MAGPEGSEAHAELRHIISQANRDMRKRREQNEAAVSQAFNRMTLGGANSFPNSSTPARTASNASNVPILADPRSSQPSYSAPPAVAHIHTPPNSRDRFRYHYAPSPERAAAGSDVTQPNRMSLPHTSPGLAARYETPTRAPQARRPASAVDRTFGTILTAEQQNAFERRKQEEQYLMAQQKMHLARQQMGPTPGNSPQSTGTANGQRVFETNEPDPEGDIIRWELWALHQLFAQIGVSVPSIRNYLRDEYEEALKRKHYRTNNEQLHGESQEDSTAAGSRSVAGQAAQSYAIPAAQPAWPQHVAPFGGLDRAKHGDQDAARYGICHWAQTPRSAEYYRGYRANHFGSAFRDADYGGRRRLPDSRMV